MDSFQQVDHAEHDAHRGCSGCGGPAYDDVHADGCPIEAAELARRELAVRLQGMTPAEVDTELAPLEVKLGDLISRQWYHLSEGRKEERKTGRFAAERAERHARDAADLVEPIDAATAAVLPYRDEFTRRGGWPRIFWCTANGGHAHSSTSCRTLHITTGMVWLPDLSGNDEAALVELAGESACTVCYPSAPVEVREKPSQLAPAKEAREAKEARAREAAERKAAKDAKGITNPDGSPLVVNRWEVKTEHAARNEYVKAAAEAADLAEGLGYCHPSRREELAREYAGHAEQFLAALAHKHGRTVEEERVELAPKVAARRAKDARERARFS